MKNIAISVDVFFQLTQIPKRLSFLITFLMFSVDGHAAESSLTYDFSGNTLSQLSSIPTLPAIVAHPSPLFTAAPGETASFSVNTASALALTYQWYFNGTLISGAIGDSLLLTNVTAASVGNYTVTVTNSLGSVTSNPGRFAIDTNNNLLGDTWEMTYFGNLLQTASADFDGDNFSNLDEYNNGTNPTIREVIYWVASSGDYNNPSNWSYGKVPNADDTVIINSGTCNLPAGTYSVGEITISVPITVTTASGQTSLIGKWFFNGPLTLASGRLLEIAGSTTEVIATGSSNANGASILVTGGAKATFGNLASYTQPANVGVYWQADDAGSELTFTNLASITGPSTPGEYLEIYATYSGKVNFPALTTITKASDGDTSNNSGVILSSTNSGLLSAPVITAFNDNDPYPDSRLVAGTTSSLFAPLLLAPKGASIDLNELSDPRRFTSLTNARTIKFNSGSGSPLVSNLASITGNTTLHLTGGANIAFNGLTTVNNLTSILVDGTSKASFGAVTSYTHPATLNLDVSWTARYTGGELNFPSLATISGPTTPGEYLSILAEQGGKVSFPALTSITKPTDGDTSANSGVILASTYAALLSAPVLTTFNDNDPFPDSYLDSDATSTLSAPLLLAPKGASIDLNELSEPRRFTSITNARTIKFNSGAGSPVVSNLTAINGYTTLHLTGGANVSFSSLTSISNLTSILVDNASKATFGAVTSYTHPSALNLDVSWTARHAGSELTFPNMTAITGPSTPGEYLSILAEQGGKVSFPALTSITKPTDGDTSANSGVELLTTNASQLLAPALTAFNDNDLFPDSRLVSDATSTLSAPLLLAPKGTSIDLNELSNPRRFTSLTNARTIKFNNGSGVAQVSNLASITGNTTLHVTNGANVTFANLTSVASLTSILVDDASKASFSAVTSYTHPAALNLSVSWTARHANSELNFPNLATVNGPSTAGEYLSILAEQGGKVSFAALTAITKPTDGDSSANSGIILSATTASQLTAPLLTAFNDNDSFPNSYLVSDATSTLSAPLLLAPKGASIDLNELSDPIRFTSLTNARTVKFNSGSGAALLSNLATVTGNTTFHLTGGTNVTFSSLSSISNLTSILVDNTAKATFNAVISYTQPADIGVTWTADDAGSILNFTNLASIIGPATPGEYLQITGKYGGKVLFPTLTSISKAADGDSSTNSGVSLWAYGGGTISAPLLSVFRDLDSRPGSELERDTTSILNLASLRQENLQGVVLTGVTLLTGSPVVQLPVINSPSTVTGFVGNAFTYQISATNTPFFFNATPLPPGLALNALTGLISGETGTAGVYNLTLRAINLDGETTRALTITVTTPASVVSPSGLYSWWKGDEDGRDAIGGQNGTLQGGTTIQSGRVGNAFSFTGTNQNVVIPQSPSLDLSRLPEWTIEAWVSPTSFTGSSYPTIYAQGPFGVSFGLNYSTGKLESWINDSNRLTTTATVPLNRWTHVAMSYNGVNRVFYINGVNVGFAASPAITDLNASSSIGNVTGSASNSQFFGKIDELAVYGRVLTDAEITAIHASGIAGKTLPPATPPVILTQPVAASVREGVSVTFSVTAIGPAPLTYQWLKGTSPLNGKTAATLELPAVLLGDAGQYSVVVSSPGGSTASQAAALTVTPDPSILLANNVAVTGLSETVASMTKLFHIVVPSGQARLVVRLSGGTGDADLYVRRVTDPTTTVYDFRSNGGTNLETITITNPQAGDWRFMVNAYSPYSNLTITANYVPPTFDEYLSNAGVPVDERGHLDDPDNDDTSNLIEYALGMAPMTPSTTGLPQALISGGILTFTYSKMRQDLIYAVETSTNLGTGGWTSAGVNQGTPDANNRVSASVPMGASARFLRLSVRTSP
ncbi:MAG: hypothetical protein RLZZ398_771 [Verrucomicrobiota bacterium]|jgi:hypothetical protein